MENVNELRVVWYLVVLIGIGYLFPLSALVQPIDFWNMVFPGFNIDFPITTLYMWTNLIVLGSIVFMGRKPSYTFRIIGGFIGQLLVLVTVPTMYFFEKSEHDYYVVVMTTTAIAAMVTASVDSVAISFASQFPSVGIEALQLGIGLSSLIGCLYRVFTKLVLPNDTVTSTVIYFYSGALTILICIIGYYVLLTLPITQKSMSTSSIDVKDAEIGQGRSSTSTSVNDREATETTSLLTKPVTYQTAETPIVSCCGKKACCCGGNGSCTCGGGLFNPPTSLSIPPRKRTKWELLLHVAWIEFLVFLTYFSTMLIWPGVITEISSHQYPDYNTTTWWPLLLLLNFSIFDCIGRFLAPYRLGLHAKNIWIPVFLRLLLFPFVFLSAMNVITWDVIPVIAIAAIGISNGYIGSICIICTTEIIEEEEKAIVGGYTGFFLNLGLVLGSSAAYLSQRIVHMH